MGAFLKDGIFQVQGDSQVLEIPEDLQEQPLEVFVGPFCNRAVCSFLLFNGFEKSDKVRATS